MRVFWLAKILEIVKMFAEGAFSDYCVFITDGKI